MDLHDKLFDTETIAELVAIKYFDYKKGEKNTRPFKAFSSKTELELFNAVIKLFKRALNIDLKIYIGVLNSLLYNKQAYGSYTFYTNTNVIIKITVSGGDGVSYNMSCSFADKTHPLLTHNFGRNLQLYSNIELYLKVDKEHIIEKIIYLPRMINDYLMICTDEYIIEILKLPNSTTNILVEQLTDKCSQLQQDNLSLIHNLTDTLHKLEIEIQKNSKIHNSLNHLKNKYITLLETKLDTTLKQKTNKVTEKDSDDEYEEKNIHIRIRGK